MHGLFSVECLAIAFPLSVSSHLLPTQVVDQQGFVYLKGSKILFHLLNMQLESHQTVLQAPYHGREANCVTVLQQESNGELPLTVSLWAWVLRQESHSACLHPAGSVYLATGSEDCTIQITEYSILE